MAEIVLVEDDEIVGQMVEATLGTRGHHVEIVNNGNDALTVIRDHHPDLVVLDCGLPGRSGLAVLKDMRDSATFSGTPVLIMSARRSDWYVNLTMQQGADDYVKKPFDPYDLVHRVETLLNTPCNHASGVVA